MEGSVPIQDWTLEGVWTARLPHQVKHDDERHLTPRVTCLVAATLTDRDATLCLGNEVGKSWDSSKASALWILPSRQRRWPSCCTWKKKKAPTPPPPKKKAAKCHHGNRWSQCVYKHLPSGHFTFQTQIDVLAIEQDESRVCYTYCSVMSQIVSLCLKKKKKKSRELGFYFWWAINSQCCVHSNDNKTNIASISE